MQGQRILLYTTFNFSYPTSAQEESLAIKIVQEFPSLKSECDGCLGHVNSYDLLSSFMHLPYTTLVFQEHFFDKKSTTGFIEYRFKTMRRKLTPSKKKYRKRLSAADQSCSTISGDQESSSSTDETGTEDGTREAVSINK